MRALNREYQNSKESLTIAFVGLDGSGKTTQCKNLLRELNLKLGLKTFSMTEISKKPQFSHKDVNDFIAYLNSLAEFTSQYDVLNIRSCIASQETLNLSERVFHQEGIFSGVKYKSLVLDLCKSTIDDHLLFKQYYLDKMLKTGKIIIYDRIPISDVFYKQLYNIQFEELMNMYKGILISPDISFLLDVYPQTSKNRSGHNTVLFRNMQKLNELRSRFIDYFEQETGHTKIIINSEKSTLSVQKEINSIVLPKAMRFINSRIEQYG